MVHVTINLSHTAKMKLRSVCLSFRCISVYVCPSVKMFCIQTYIQFPSLASMSIFRQTDSWWI